MIQYMEKGLSIERGVICELNEEEGYSFIIVKLL